MERRRRQQIVERRDGCVWLSYLAYLRVPDRCLFFSKSSWFLITVTRVTFIVLSLFRTQVCSYFLDLATCFLCQIVNYISLSNVILELTRFNLYVAKLKPASCLPFRCVRAVRCSSCVTSTGYWMLLRTERGFVYNHENFPFSFYA